MNKWLRCVLIIGAVLVILVLIFLAGLFFSSDLGSEAFGFLIFVGLPVFIIIVIVTIVTTKNTKS